VNPYVFGPPIKREADFFGRNDETALAFQHLQRSASLAVIGERRVGRTSFLHHLRNLVPNAWRRTPQPAVVLVNAQRVGAKSEEEFERYLVREIIRQCPGLELSTSDAAKLCLTDCLERITPRELVLLLDEFEVIAENPSFASSFFDDLRYCSETDNLSLVVSSKRSLEECCASGNLSLDFAEFLMPIHLRPFGKEELGDFVAQTSEQSGVSLKPWLDDIQDISGGFPSFAQMFCSHLYEACVAGDDEACEELVRAQRAFTFRVRPFFQHIWDELSDEEQKALKVLVQGQTNPDSLVLEQLRLKGYVQHGHVFSSVFAEMFLKDGMASELEKDEKDSEGSVRKDDKGNIYFEGQKVDPPLPKLQSRLFNYLYENMGRVCTKYDIVMAVWSEDYLDAVDDARIAKLVSRLRKELGEDARHPKHLFTVHGRGYRLEP
jgi:DNA-binding winged helix-turn-helix (wHTH) protein